MYQDKDLSRRDFTKLIAYCRKSDAFQDAPFSFPFTFQAMDAAFPRSHFILTVRASSDEWYRSLTHFHGKLFSDGRVPPTRADLEAAHYIRKGRPWTMNRLLFDSPDDDPYERETLIRHYEAHVYSVQQYFRHRPADLLVLDVSTPGAYQRLCSFLGEPAVERDFPRLNPTNAL